MNKENSLNEPHNQQLNIAGVSRSDFSVGDIIIVNPDLISEITYTNKPQIGMKYQIRCEWGGDIWTFGLSYLSGQDANIHISWKHILHCG